MIDQNILSRFLDGDRVKIIPSKRSVKLMVFEYLASKFEEGRFYSEKEVNEIINQYQTASDHATLRRDLFDNNFLDRDPSGLRYWRTKVALDKA